MEYTSYLSNLLKANGMPHFTLSGFQTMMNIVHLEGRIEELKKLEKQGKDSFMKGQYTYNRQNYQRRISELTGNKIPSVLMMDLCRD